MQKVYGDLQRLNKRSGGSMGINAWNSFALGVEYPYIVGKSEKSLDMGEPTFYVEMSACYHLQKQTVLPSVQQTILYTQVNKCIRFQNCKEIYT